MVDTYCHLLRAPSRVKFLIQIRFSITTHYLRPGLPDTEFQIKVDASPGRTNLN